MGKVLSVFGDEFDTGNYRYSVWITNSHDPAYDVWKQCRPRANDENTIKELKEDFALGGFSMKYFYSTEAAMLIRVNKKDLIFLISYFRRSFLISPILMVTLFESRYSRRGRAYFLVVLRTSLNSAMVISGFLA